MLRRVLVILSYVLLAVVVVGLTFALVAYGNDYTYDFKTRQFVQRGHVIVESAPGGASVTADGKPLNKRTPYQGVYSVGPHTFELVRDGYRTWRKTVNVVAGEVSLVNYVLLVRDKPVEKVLDTRPTVVAHDISRDHRTLTYAENLPQPAVFVRPVSASAKAVRVYAPVPAADGTTETIERVVLSDDASHVLIGVRRADGARHYLVAADGTGLIDLTAQYKFDFTSLGFSANTWRQLYWMSPDGLRRLDAEAQTVSAVLAEKVSQFWVIPDRVLYVAQTDLGRSLWSLDNRGRKQLLIQSLPVSERYSLSYATWRGEPQLAIVPIATGIGTLYSDVFGDKPTAKVIARGVSEVAFSPDGHNVAFYAPGGAVTSYDLEQSRLRGRSFISEFPAMSTKLEQLTWLDNYHVLMTRDGRIYLADFDGANLVDLGPGVPNWSAYRSPDFDSAIVFRPLPTGIGIVDIHLRD